MKHLNLVLDRIGYTGSTEPTIETLQSLQHQFLLTVPFENLDIGLGIPISLEANAIYDKMVRRQRGGFCFECNSLFYCLLEQLGFSVRYASARMEESGDFKDEFGHMVLIVDLDGPVLVDVGNGQSCRDPIRLDDPTSRTAEGIDYRVRPAPREYSGAVYALELRAGDAPFLPRYVFSTRERQITDFHDMCRYHQVSPDSVFTRGRLVTLALPQGRVTLTKNRLSKYLDGSTVERDIPESEIADVLRSEFRINLPLPE